MGRRSGARFAGSGRLLAILCLSAIAVFLVGEAVLMARSEAGSLFLARQGLPYPRDVVRSSLSQTLRASLWKLGIPSSAQTVPSIAPAGDKPLACEVRLPARASLFLVNAAITEAFEARGARVVDAVEASPLGERVTMTLGIGHSVTHEVVLVRGNREGHERVRLAIVVEGFAREETDSAAARALRLPFPFAGAVVANGDRPGRWAERLRDGGREVIAQLPMEPMNYPARSPGKNAILVDMARNQIRRLVGQHLGTVKDPIAALPYMGGMALQDHAAMRAICTELRARHVAYLEVAGETHSVGLETAASMDVSFLRIDARLDPVRGGTERDARQLRERLRVIADTARRRGFAALAVPLDVATLRLLEREMPRLEAQGVDVVPIGELLRPRVS